MSINIQSYENASCLKCECIQKEMIKVGAFIMCPTCFDEEFKNIKAFENQFKEKYSIWLQIYQKKHE